MRIFDAVILGIWLIAGLLTFLQKGDVPKISFIFCWVSLVFALLSNAFA